MNISDVLIHVDQSLGLAQRTALEGELREIPGVVAPRFGPGTEHLLVVAFDPDRVRAKELLDRVISRGYSAQLVGA